MSGITPLIDTLMHQVLGRKGELSQRPLNAPVQPVPPGEGPRALQGDSSLDGRPLSSPLDDLRRLSSSLDGQRLPAAKGEAASTPLGSTQTHFSPAARTIADVLLRFPAPPAMIRPQAPLMGLEETPSAAALASRLESSVRDSGLFYESHLKRWFQGESSRQQLLREPQMQPGPRPLLPVSLATFVMPPFAANATLGASNTNVAILPNSLLIPVASDQAGLIRPAALMPMDNTLPAGAQRESVPANVSASASASIDMASARAMEESSLVRGGREIVHESLQSLVRQQLDMLVMPVIRWEGDVWAGIFMALVIHMPTREGERESAQQEAEGDGVWQSDMQLDVPNLGAFSVALRLYQSVLSIDLTTDTASTYQSLELGSERLEKRLRALDFRSVQVKAHYATLESHDGDIG
ncbi:flagellar hook-length control protein FliK [Halomonas sp. XH26]|uniref:flagellar hook-length control protein FliK n=1 Tax=Halomonadaceae TaxID=28256 RepID=UPI000EA29551|nr:MULTISPECIES: flagellar hook-length control protein FliK [Halomonas]AYF33291.1 flagellar hook-length control protein FliK [Halomonas alkaliphila]UTA80029.1 flagellar hook-length control protein FliK [Halomonas sp. XH26]